MTLARERDQWFWVSWGAEAVALASACAARARKEGRPDIADRWDKWVEVCTADRSRPLRIKLPVEFVERRINQPRYSQEPWWKGL
jgi:hypothetical protein